MRTRKTILILAAITSVLVILIFIWQVSALPNLKFQISSGLHNNLEKISHNAGESLNKHYKSEITKGIDKLRKNIKSENFNKESLADLRYKFLLVASTQPLSDAWMIIFANRQNNRLSSVEYKKPNRYRKETGYLGGWREETDLSQFISKELRKLIQPYVSIDSFANHYWENAVDSNIVFVYDQAFSSNVIIGKPFFREDSTLGGFIFTQTSSWYLENIFIRDFFNEHFSINPDYMEGLKFRHLQFGVIAGNANRLIYNSVAYGSKEFEHIFPLSNVNSWLSDFKVGVRFRGSSVDEVATSIYNRNLFLIIVLFALLMIVLILLFLAAIRMVKLSRLKTEFVANVSHEIKTPLTSIKLASDSLELDRIPDPEQRKVYIRIIKNEAERLQYLIHTLLDFSSLETGKKRYRFEFLETETWWKEIVEFFEEKSQELKISDPPEFKGGVKVDRKAMEQVFGIFIDNAHKYSETNKEIELSCTIKAGSIRVNVKDHGIGIAQEHQTIIFDKFVRIGNMDIHNVKGHGIGLSIAKAIMNDHGGKIGVRSKPGQGSTFYIEMPFIVEK